MSSQSSRATVVFSCLGHLYIHLCTAVFFVIVLSLESVWQRPYHGLVFGIKFVPAFGAAPLAVQLVAAISGRTGDFYWVYALLAVFAFVAVCVACLLPRARRMPAPQPVGGLNGNA